MYRKYPKYKDSGVEWIGEIPVHWGAKRSRLVFSLIKGKNPSQLFDCAMEGMLPYLSMEYLRGNKENLKYCDEKGSVLTYEKDILLLWDGSNAGEIIDGKKGILSSTLAKMYNCKEHPFYYKYVLKSFESILKNMNVGMGIPHVDGEFLRNSYFPIPEYSEQKAIADYLDRKTAQIDDLLAKKERMTELLKEERTAVINQAMTKGLDPKAEMKDSGIEWPGKVPKHWKMKRLKYLVSLINQPIEDEISVTTKIDLENLESWTGKIIETENQDLSVDGMKTFVIGDVLFNKLRPYLAKVYRAQECGVCGGELLVLRPTSLIDSDFLFYRVSSSDFINVVDGSTYGTKMPRASWDFIGNLCIPFPEKTEQVRIAEYLSSFFKKTDLILKKLVSEIEYLKEYRTALISEVVTGKIDVRN